MTTTNQRFSSFVKGFFAFLLIAIGYRLTFSYHYDDALTAARELDGQFVQGPLSLVEFRHFVNHLWPYWLLQFLHSLGIHISGIQLIHAWDLATASAAILLVYVLLRELVRSPYIALAGAFAYSTAHCVWLYAATGRLYSTSMVFALSAYYLAIQMRKPLSPRTRLAIAVSAAGMVCFACYFWLVHVFNAVGVGVLLLLLPVEDSWLPRIRRTLVFGVTGILLTAIVGVSSLAYAGVPLTQPGIRAWMAGSGTQPMKFGLLGIMAGFYGQADGVLAIPNLVYVVHGWMLKDPKMQGIASFPWQFAKFLLVWVLLALAYIYPWLMFRRATNLQRSIILGLYVPIAINMFFGLGWLGTDVQRFLPALISEVCLAAMSFEDWMYRTSRPRALAVCGVSALLFIAAVNLWEEELPDQQRYVPLAAQTEAAKPYVRPADLLITFGRDFDNPYSTTMMYYTGASYLTLTNDVTYYDWDSPSWQATVDSLWRKTTENGGRVFVVDRLVSGAYPALAAWSEVQHPRPTVKQFADFLQAHYCVTPAFYVGATRYFDLRAKNSSCDTGSPQQASSESPSSFNTETRNTLRLK